ncbi:MAG: GGGtGRT protein, partial [Kiritimatiellae bacterium]|nr:GGGtGRT protein [Kiritimatiellia bacterium]
MACAKKCCAKKAAPKAAAAEKLFEGYERREAKILAALKPYGIKSILECKEICDKAGIDPYKIVEETQPICFENAKWAYTVGAAMAIKKGCT